MADTTKLGLSEFNYIKGWFPVTLYKWTCDLQYIETKVLK